MKKLLIISAGAILFFSCGKENVYRNDFFGTVAFINASPGVSGTAGQPGLNLFIDTILQTSSIIGYRSASGYLTTSPGNRNLQIRSSLNNKTVYVDLPSQTITGNKASTYIIYDTLSAANPSLKTLRLDDDLTFAKADSGSIKFRFLNLAVNSGPLDITFLRTSATPMDSVTITNQNYIGANPSSATFSPFKNKLPVGAYTIKVKAAGTQNVLTSTTITLAPFGSIQTFYTTGTAAGAALSIGAFRHYP